jgi:hypothetical protein
MGSVEHAFASAGRPSYDKSAAMMAYSRSLALSARSWGPNTTFLRCGRTQGVGFVVDRAVIEAGLLSIGQPIGISAQVDMSSGRRSSALTSGYPPWLGISPNTLRGGHAA